jgi:predicted nucleotidyltransferase
MEQLFGHADPRIVTRSWWTRWRRIRRCFILMKVGRSEICAEQIELCQTGNTNMPETAPVILAPPSADDPMLAEVVRRLQELYHPERIYLFGSTARGESGPDSDYDLMVVVPDSTPVSLRDSGRAYKAIWRLGLATDVLVWTHSDFEERLPLKASLPSTIAREGKLLYAA